jgi:hypothetical protein
MVLALNASRSPRPGGGKVVDLAAEPGWSFELAVAGAGTVDDHMRRWALRPAASIRAVDLHAPRIRHPFATWREDASIPAPVMDEGI